MVPVLPLPPGGSARLYGEEVAQKLPSYQLQRPSRRGLLLDLQMQKKIWMDVLSRLDLQGRDSVALVPFNLIDKKRCKWGV